MSLAFEGGKGYSRQTTTYQKRHYCMHSFTSHKGVHPRTWAWTGAWVLALSSLLTFNGGATRRHCPLMRTWRIQKPREEYGAPH